MNYKKDTKSGLYKLTNPAKYFSDRPPLYKSAWELHTFVFFERSPYILKWGYECIPIYYYHPFYHKMTTYYPDLWCHIKVANGNEYKMLIEIKPKKFRKLPQKPKEPVRPKNLTSDTIAKYNKQFERHRKALLRYDSYMKDFAVNSAKWEAAQVWCGRNNVIWKIMDEDNVNNFFSGQV